MKLRGANEKYVLIVIFWGILRVIVGFLKRDAPRMFQQLLPVLGIQMI